MKDQAKDLYDQLKVSEQAWLRADGGNLSALNRFQNVILAAQAMMGNGLIAILDKHHESQTGQRMVDAIRIHRLK
jgi:hypothetical protein